MTAAQKRPHRSGSERPENSTVCCFQRAGAEAGPWGSTREAGDRAPQPLNLMPLGTVLLTTFIVSRTVPVTSFKDNYELCRRNVRVVSHFREDSSASLVQRLFIPHVIPQPDFCILGIMDPLERNRNDNRILSEWYLSPGRSCCQEKLTEGPSR